MDNSPSVENFLLGFWRKSGPDDCDMAYPDEIEFRSNGLYQASSSNSRKHPYWDIGSYEILAPDTVRISTANDAEVVYEFGIAGDQLSFSDPAGCRFSYCRVS